MHCINITEFTHLLRMYVYLHVLVIWVGASVRYFAEISAKYYARVWAGGTLGCALSVQNTDTHRHEEGVAN